MDLNFTYKDGQRRIKAPETLIHSKTKKTVRGLGAGDLIIHNKRSYLVLEDRAEGDVFVKTTDMANLKVTFLNVCHLNKAKIVKYKK